MLHLRGNDFGFQAILFLMVLSPLLGCDSGPSLSPVHGRVTFQGKPVAQGTVRFFPVAGGRPSIGRIQPDGTYQLATATPGDGALPGEYAITIEAKRTTTSGRTPMASNENDFDNELGLLNTPYRIEYLVPTSYSSQESSGLSATVEARENEINFDLP